MKRILLAALLLLSVEIPSLGQQAASDAPATKEDIQKYFEVTHSREMITKMMDATMKPIHQMTHEQYLKDKDRLPPDFEEQMNKKADDLLKAFPWDEMLQAMIPVYQKHFTRGDVNALTSFYGTPTGQKLLREMPAITAEAMQSMMPLMQKQMESMQERLQQEIARMKKDAEAKPREKS